MTTTYSPRSMDEVAFSSERHKLHAWNNYVCVRLQQAEDILIAGGQILIPHANGKAVVHGVIESVGPDAAEGLRPGLVALVPPYGVGMRIEFEHVLYIMILDYEVLGTWSQEDFDYGKR